MRKSIIFLMGLAILGMVLAACGGDDTPAPQATSTPQPTATPLDVGAITSALQQTIRSTVDDALAGITPAEGLSASQINRIVEAAVTAAIPDTASAEEISALVETAVAASVTPGLSADEITSLVSSAVAEATAGQADPLTAAEVEAIVSRAISGIPTATPQPTATPAPTPTAFDIRQGGIITMTHFASPPHWDTYSGTFTSFVANNPTHSKVLMYDPESDDPIGIKGDLADRWDVSADGTSYTFFLNQNARWHDGMPVTAEDVVFSLESMVDPDAVRPQVGALGDYYKGSIAIDANTVQVDTKFKAAAFVPLFAADFIQIRAKHRFEGMSDDDAKLQENQLGSGPFMVKRAEKDVVIEYVRNPDYFKEGLPYVDGVTWFIVLSPAATFAAHEAGQALMASSIASRMNNTSATQLAESTLGKGTVHWGGPAAGLSIFMNHEKPPFDDKNVRLALSLAIDRHQMINTLALGRATLGYAMPPGLYYSIPDAEVAQLPGYRLLDGEKHPDDIAEAQRLMAAAGLADGFTTEIMAHGIADTIDISQIAADGWRKWLNLDIEVVQEAFGTALERRNNGDYLMYTDTDGVTYLDPDDMFSRRYGSDSLHADYNNWSGNARIDEIRALQTSEFDLQVRGDLIREAAELFLVDAPWAVLYWKDLFMFVDNRVRNFHMQVTAYTKTGLYENLWCDPQC